MPFTFPRVSAGIYEVQKDSNTVGFIRKAAVSKWIVTDVVDTPQHVTKTLKEAKDACINLIMFNVEEKENTTDTVNLDSSPDDEYNDSVEFNATVNPELNEVLEGSLNCYKQIDGTDEFEQVSPSEFGFPGPTLDPIIF